MDITFARETSEGLESNRVDIDQSGSLKEKLEALRSLQPDNHNKKYESLFNEIDTGQIKLPMFQREFNVCG